MTEFFGGASAPDAQNLGMVPMVIETSVGIDRTCLAILADSFCVEELEGGESRTLAFARAIDRDRFEHAVVSLYGHDAAYDAPPDY